ncbi:DUF1624 domain-containing protein [Pseudenhygromyxa sp. WMMC2535]|uniref:heparan-alpha-glucosaminide N-acetyltransferase domain-containing protein n=1 Tax=Pseudenhygromyxa sp. WMMC2535 TaxID=2712867 RepID=UPI001552D794|nr:heparan-alpha-glucosaminide N-acetyltransferase domain-containing protein [Pseudenhygromyxa sp. WMMC2535]NVB36592.1 DUF1624 domain-containing protein [Pseudenhygromyxa sp. WMMC2535]
MSGADTAPSEGARRLGRVETIDVGRGLSVVIMIMVHTLWMYGSVETQTESGLGMALHFLGKGTAAFLVAMGFSFMLSRDQSVTGPMRRGLMLMAIGYAMNLLKFVVPAALGLLPDAFIAAYGWTPPARPDQLLYMLMTGDILQLAGLCSMMMGLIRRWSAGSKYWLLVWAAVFAAGTHLLRGLHVGVAGIDGVLDLLWGTQWNVYFPVFPWFAAILFGMFLGAEFCEHGDEDRLFRRGLVYGLCLIVPGVALIAAWPQTHFVDFFHLGFGGIIYLIGVNLVALWVVHRLIRRRERGRLRALLDYASARVTSLYVIQWVVICWGMSVVGYQTLGTWGVVAAIPLTSMLSFGIRVLLDEVAALWRGRP